MTDDDLNAGYFGDPPPAGHNNPPSDPMSTAEDLFKRANMLLTEIPIIKTKEQADVFGILIGKLSKAFRALEDERDAKVRPLNTQVEAINASYRPVKKTIGEISEKLLFVNRGWLIEQDRLQKAEANRLREEAERKAAEAQEAQQRAKEEAERAKDGDVTDGPIDVVGATLDANKATLDAHIAQATAAKAEKTKVSSGGGDGMRSVKLTQVEVPSIANKTEMLKVVKLIGMSYGLPESVVLAAKAYHRATKIWPPGIKIEIETR